MAENFSRLNRIVKKDPYITPSSPFEKFVANGGSGGGMPDASGLKDGTVMVAVGGKFVPVEGYGYSASGGSYGPFYWDGVYHADDPDVIVASDSGTNLIMKKIADDNSFINLSSSIHILEESGDEYDLTASDSGYDSTILFMASGFSHMVMLIRDPDVWSEIGVDANDTGLFSYIFSTGAPSDGDQLCPPSEFTVLGKETLVAFNKKYIPSVIDIKIVQELPGIGESGIIYMVPDYSDSEDRFSEYIWNSQNRNYEMLGHRKIDLSDYVTNTQLNNKNYVTNTQLNNKDYVTNTQLNNKNYVTNIQLNNKGFITGAQVDSKLNAKIVAGTTEYEDGVTDLANGVVYLQYEV